MTSTYAVGTSGSGLPIPQETAVPAATGCGQAAVATDGQSSASGCGQSGQMSQCGQRPEPAGQCGQMPEPHPREATASQCGQSAVPTGGPSSASGCGQSGQTSQCGQTPEPAGQCGQAASSSGAYQRLNAAEMDAWRAFLAASTEVTARLNRELEAGTGISMHEYEILVRLLEAPDHTLRMSDLADHVSHSRSRLTHTVGRLEKEGYVERFSCASDRRGVNCRLTEAGEAFLRQAAPIHLAGVRRHVLDRLDPDFLGTFTQVMTALASNPDAEQPS